MNYEKEIRLINECGMLLVFPIKNKKEPASLWSRLYPRISMDWKWDDSGDNRVVKLWATMKALSSSGQVVYSKWYQGRATFISKELFMAMLTLVRHAESFHLNSHAQNIYERLLEDSPLSTKQIKELCELRGRDFEKYYNQAIKQLFLSLKIVAFGEVDDGAFPSLAMGSTALLFEDVVLKSENLSLKQAQIILNKYLPMESAFRIYFNKIYKFV